MQGRYWRGGIPKIELVVTFTPEDRAATKQVAKLWYDNQSPMFKDKNDFVEPGDSQEVTLILDGDFWQAGESPAERAQFQGRYYTTALLNRGRNQARSFFRRLPGIFWFDQFRNLADQVSSDSRADSTLNR